MSRRPAFTIDGSALRRARLKAAIIDGFCVAGLAVSIGVVIATFF